MRKWMKQMLSVTLCAVMALTAVFANTSVANAEEAKFEDGEYKVPIKLDASMNADMFGEEATLSVNEGVYTLSLNVEGSLQSFVTDVRYTFNAEDASEKTSGGADDTDYEKYMQAELSDGVATFTLDGENETVYLAIYVSAMSRYVYAPLTIDFSDVPYAEPVENTDENGDENAGDTGNENDGDNGSEDAGENEEDEKGEDNEEVSVYNLADGTYTTTGAVYTPGTTDQPYGDVIESVDLVVENNVVDVTLNMQSVESRGSIMWLAPVLTLVDSEGNETVAEAVLDEEDELIALQQKFTLAENVEYIDIWTGYYVPGNALSAYNPHYVTSGTRTLYIELETLAADVVEEPSENDNGGNDKEEINLADGIYTTTGAIYVPGTTDQPYGDVIESADLAVEDGKIDVTLNMQGIHNEEQGHTMWLAPVLTLVDSEGNETVAEAVLDEENELIALQQKFTLAENVEYTDILTGYYVADYDGYMPWNPHYIESTRTLYIDLEGAQKTGDLQEDPSDEDGNTEDPGNTEAPGDEDNGKEQNGEEELDINNLPDGIYEVPVALWNATQDQASMGAAGLLGATDEDPWSTARIVVEEGEYTMYIYTQEMQFGVLTARLQSFQVEGENAQTIGTEWEDPTAFYFTMPYVDEYMNVAINTGEGSVMGNNYVAARQKTDWDEIVKVSDDTDVTEAPADEVTVDPIITDPVADAQSSDDGTLAGAADTTTASSGAAQTGDTTNLFVYIMAMMLALFAAAYGTKNKWMAMIKK